jgi:hypothetical protein
MAVEGRRRTGQLTAMTLVSGVLGAAALTVATIWSAFFP